MSERYDDVRRQLVQRGYLQGPIERFVLRDFVSAEGRRALARTSFKAAMLGAPVLGGLLAATTVAANRPVLGARDALVLWFYFALVAGVALFALDLIAASLASAVARKRGARSTDAVRAGLIVTVPVLVYLVVLWARGRPEGGFGEDALFLAAAVLTVALVTWLAGLVSLAGIVGRTGEVPDRNRRSAMLVLAVLAPVAAAYFVLPGALTASRSDAIPPSDFTPAPRSKRLLVVGIDGLDGGLVEAQSDHGATNLLALLSRGALFPKHRAAAEPAEVWTTIATGVGPDDHGVRSAGSTRLPGVAAPIAVRSRLAAYEAALRFLLPARTVPSSGAGRRVRALWEMAGLTRPAAVVGWWATWPASGTEGDPQSGYVVSDRVLAKLLSHATEDRDTAPPSLFARLANDFPSERAAWRRTFASRFSDLPVETAALVWESFLIDTFAWTTTKRLLDDPEVATSFTYLPGLDILRTRLARGAAATRAIEGYVHWLDESIIAELAARADDMVLLVADAGRSAGRDEEGFVAVIGGGAVPFCIGTPVGDRDVAPIALRLAGLPASREMEGFAPARCFEGVPPAPPVVATWGRRGRPAKAPASDYDPDMVLRLKSLGYLR